MTQRKSSPARAEKLDQNARTDFSRPDAETAAEGGPAHEDAEAHSEESAPDAAQANDDAHGYSQDSGYQTSGGYSPEQRKAGTGNGHAHSDEQIRADVQERLQQERAPRASRLIVSVGHGVVTLRGEVDDEGERERLTQLVREVPSVREVRQELSVRAARNNLN